MVIRVIEHRMCEQQSCPCDFSVLSDLIDLSTSGQVHPLVMLPTQALWVHMHACVCVCASIHACVCGVYMRAYVCVCVCV